MFKKLACIGLSAVMAVSLVACGGDKASSSSTTELTDEVMTSSLEAMADELELYMKESDPDVDVMLVVAEDGSCKLVAVSKDEAEETELELNTAESVKDMFAAYQEAGFLSETGEVLGFPELPEVDEGDASESVPAESTDGQEEVIDTTGLTSEGGQIAGFPGEGTIDVGDVEVDNSESTSEVSSAAESTAEASSVATE